MSMNLPISDELELLILYGALQTYRAQQESRLTNPDGKSRTTQDQMTEGYIFGIEQLLTKLQTLGDHHHDSASD